MIPIFLNIAHIKQTEIQSIASIMFETLAIHQSDSQDALLEKLEALKSFKLFLITHIHFNKLSDKKAKLQYVEFIDKLNQQIEDLEKLSGQITQEELNNISKSFSKKTDFPVGIYE
jgi:hypothetical protein